MFKFILAFLIAWSDLAFNASAQLLPPNQPEQNACQALFLCGKTFTSPYGYQGIGTISDLATTPCGSGEANSLWLRIQVTAPGLIVFTISPTDTADDYDFAIVDITHTTCDSFTSNDVVRCNFNNNFPPYNKGVVGLNTTSTLQFVQAGFTGGSYLEAINANAGDVYLIMINNFGTGFSGPKSGFTIDFTGSTATFNQPPPPKFADMRPTYCGFSHEVILQLSDNVLCSSIAADGSDFSLSPTGTIQSASGINCTGSSGYTNKIKITFNGILPTGNYALHAQTGTDGNTLLGLCNSELVKPDSLNFKVDLTDSIHITRIDSPACQTLTLHLSSPVACNTIATDGSDFTIEGPSSVVIASASGTGCTSGDSTETVILKLAQPIAVDGLYKVKAKTGSDGNTLMDICGHTMPVGEAIPFIVNSFNGMLTAHPDTTICDFGNVVHLYGVNKGFQPSSGFQYQWIPGTGIQNPNSLNTQLRVSDTVNHYLLQTVDGNGCYLRDSLTITVHPFHGDLNPADTAVCFNDTLTLLASGGVAYQWFDNLRFTGKPATLSCNFCPDPIALPPVGDHVFYVVMVNEQGCTDTLQTLVHIRPLPYPDIRPHDTTIRYGTSITLHAANGGIAYYWSPTETLNDPEVQSPVATPVANTDYIVVVTDQYGCVGSDTAHVRIDFNDPVFVPSAFSPNGDGLNDIFKIENLTFQKLLAFRVYDRWGRLMFETPDPRKGWDGTYHKKPVTAGVYQYYIQVGYPNGRVETLKGGLTLIR